ncbi:MAG TPA: TIGR02300 family protein [Acetobacteraceae bacterium]|nr:TIGR02300 family protein [Acetobacteraceae bacterium]
MVKPELGTKRMCVSCGARFYDLGKTPAVCPKCATEQPPEQPRLKRAQGNLAEEKRVKKPAPVPGLEDADVEVAGADDEAAEDDVLEDAADLEDDADAIDGEIEVAPDTEERDR